MRVGGVTSELNLPSLTVDCPWSTATRSCGGTPSCSCGQLQLGVPHWATSVDYCKYLIIDPTFYGSRFSTGRLLAIEDFTFTFIVLQSKHRQVLYKFSRLCR